MSEEPETQTEWDAGFEAGVNAVIQRIIYLIVGDEEEE